MAGGIGAAEATRINIAFRELDGEKLKAETALRPGYVPGDLSFDPLSLAPEDPAEFALMQEKELAHCRLGMIAAAGFLAGGRHQGHLGHRRRPARLLSRLATC